MRTKASEEDHGSDDGDDDGEYVGEFGVGRAFEVAAEEVPATQSTQLSEAVQDEQFIGQG